MCQAEFSQFLQEEVDKAHKEDSDTGNASLSLVIRGASVESASSANVWDFLAKAFACAGHGSVFYSRGYGYSCFGDWNDWNNIGAIL